MPHQNPRTAPGLSKHDLTALKRYKDLYEIIYPPAKTRAQHQDGGTSTAPRDASTRAMQQLRRAQRTFQEEHLILEALHPQLRTRQYQHQRIPRATGFILAILPQAEQIPVLDQLFRTQSSLTIEGITTVVTRRLRTLNLPRRARRSILP